MLCPFRFAFSLTTKIRELKNKQVGIYLPQLVFAHTVLYSRLQGKRANIFYIFLYWCQHQAQKLCIYDSTMILYIFFMFCSNKIRFFLSAVDLSGEGKECMTQIMITLINKHTILSSLHLNLRVVLCSFDHIPF